MIIRRIFAGSIVALLLSASSLAVACDLSCAFDSMSTDCHSQKAEHQDSSSGGMDMNGMSMAGMTMPEMANGMDQQSVSAVPGSKAGHALIGEMGPCERQACDGGSVVSAKTSVSIDSHFQFTLAETETPSADIASPLFHDARDDVAFYRPSYGSLLKLSVRI